MCQFYCSILSEGMMTWLGWDATWSRYYNQSVLVGNPSSPHGNTIFSSSNKVCSPVLIRITPVSPPYKSYLLWSGSNKWNKSHHKDANQAWKAWLPALLSDWRNLMTKYLLLALSDCWLDVNYPSLVCGVSQLSPSLIINNYSNDDDRATGNYHHMVVVGLLWSGGGQRFSWHHTPHTTPLHRVSFHLDLCDISSCNRWFKWHFFVFKLKYYSERPRNTI